MDLREQQPIARWPFQMLQAIPALAFGIYACGFLATNIHLSKFGIYEFDLVSSRYVIVGVLYLVFLAFWYFFVGRMSLYADWDEPVPEEKIGPTLSVCWWIGIIYSICVAAATFGLIFLGSAETVIFVMIAVIGWIVKPRWENLWESRDLCKYFPVGDWIIYPIMQILAMTIFFVTIESGSLVMMLFVHFLLLTFYAKFVLRRVKKYWCNREYHERPREEFLQAGLHIISFVLISCVSFGWLQYSHINPGLGGGAARNVELMVIDEATQKSMEELGLSANQSFLANIVHEDDKKIIAKVEDRIVGISKESIANVQVLSPGPFDLELYGKRVLNEIVMQWDRLRFQFLPKRT